MTTRDLDYLQLVVANLLSRTAFVYHSHWWFGIGGLALLNNKTCTLHAGYGFLLLLDFLA